MVSLVRRLKDPVARAEQQLPAYDGVGRKRDIEDGMRPEQARVDSAYVQTIPRIQRACVVEQLDPRTGQWVAASAVAIGSASQRVGLCGGRLADVGVVAADAKHVGQRLAGDVPH